jgi:tetratricopeptide (TPR) repeat protein
MASRRTGKPSDELARKVTRTVTAFLLDVHGGTQDELARSAGVSPRSVSRAATGAREVRRSILTRFASSVNLTADDLGQLWGLALRVHARRAGAPAARVTAGGRAEQGLKAAAAGLAGPLRAHLERRLDRARALKPTPGLAGKEPAALWAYLESFPHAVRLDLIDEVEELQSVDLAELLCGRSLEAAAEDSKRAVELAEAAVHAATLAPPGKGQGAAQMRAWAHLGNALRVASGLDSADRTLGTARQLWERLARRGEAPSETGLLSFEVSLRRAQRRFAEALDLLKRALASGELTCQLLLKKSSVLRELGDIEGALHVSQEVEALLHPDGDPRLRFIASFNSVDYLSVLERFTEADARLPEVQRLAAGTAREIERLRLRWVEARIAAGLGREEEGLATLEQVRQEFERRGMAYDQALTSLDLALLHLKRGENAEVRRLARGMARVFREKEIHRETLAALTLFCRAAEQESATAALARQVAHFLHAARHNPELRFGAAES